MFGKSELHLMATTPNLKQALDDSVLLALDTINNTGSLSLILNLEDDRLSMAMSDNPDDRLSISISDNSDDWTLLQQLFSVDKVKRLHIVIEGENETANFIIESGAGENIATGNPYKDPPTA